MIRIDYRERGSGVVQALEKIGCRYEINTLKAGDYVIDGRVYIERKTSRDFVSSLHSGRLFRQVAALKKFGQRQILIIEGLPLTLIRGAKPETIQGALVSLAVSWHLPVLYSECPEETALILERIRKQILSRSAPSGKKLFTAKKPARPSAHKKKILEALPLIGPNLAAALMKEFGSLEKVFNASEEELRTVRGIGKKKVKRIQDILKEQKEEYNVQSRTSRSIQT